MTEPSFLSAIGNPSSSFLGLIVALYNVGCLAGCVVSGLVGNKLGRKRSIIYGNIIMIIGGILQTAIYGSTQLIVGRLVSGVGTGTFPNTLSRPGLQLILCRHDHVYRSHLRGRMLPSQEPRPFGRSSDVPRHHRSGHPEVHSQRITGV